MRLRRLAISGSILCGAAPLGCAPSVVVKTIEVPDAIRASADERAFLEARAAGVQVYACSAIGGEPPSYAWTLRGPLAALTSPSGKAIGRHYAGPTWAASDGSQVVGALAAKAPSPDATALPWLRLDAKSTSGTGAFAQTSSIQRVQTSGGLPPASACLASEVGTQKRVPYRATYYFYRR